MRKLYLLFPLLLFISVTCEDEKVEEELDTTPPKTINMAIGLTASISLTIFSLLKFCPRLSSFFILCSTL